MTPTKYVPRSRWGARKPKSSSRLNASKPCTGHWNGPTVTVNGLTTWSHDRCAGIVRGIQNFHMDGRGWQDIAYNFVVCPHGYVFEGRGLNTRSAANGTNAGNSSSYAIQWLAGPNNPFTSGEKSGFREARDFCVKHGSSPTGAMGHRDWKATDCPGNERYGWLKSGQNGSPPAPPAKPSTKPTMRRGSRGAYVSHLQTVLNRRAKQNLKVDGMFGPATERSVKNLQRMFKLTVDGIVGPKTWAVVDFLDSL